MLLLGILFYLSSLLIGFLLSDYFFSRYVELRIIRLAMGIPMGFAIAAYLVLLMEAFVGSFNEFFMLAASLLMLALSFLLYFARRRSLLKAFTLTLEEFNAHGIFYASIMCFTAGLILLQVQGLHTVGGGTIQGGDNFGLDYLYHLGIGNSLIYTGFPPKLPYAAGALNIYPFIPDFYYSMLVYSGAGLITSYYLMNFLLYFSLIAVGSFLFYKISKSQRLPVVGMAIFIFCGQGLSLLVMLLLNASPVIPVPGSSSIFYQLTYPLFNFIQPLINNFAPQHEYLLGFPYTITIITLLYLMFLDKKKAEPSKSLFFLALLAGLLPLIHPDSFLVLCIFAIVIALYSILSSESRSRSSIFRYWFMAIVIALLAATPAVLYIHSQHLQNNIISNAFTEAVWYVQGANILYLIGLHALFWTEVLGPIFILGVLGLLTLKKREMVLFIAPLLVFLLVNLAWFPPGFGDSNKFTVYVIFFFGLSSAMLLSRLYSRKGRLVKVIAAILLIAIIFNGFAEEYFDFQAVYPVAENLSLNASSWIVNNTSPKSIFVTNCYKQTFDYLSTIAGRTTLLDMEMYTEPVGIYTYNINTVSSGIDNFMQNPSCAFAKQYNISYVVFSHLNSLPGAAACASVDYISATSSRNLTYVNAFLDNATNESILVYKTKCR